jgi:hypothetical protein
VVLCAGFSGLTIDCYFWATGVLSHQTINLFANSYYLFASVDDLLLFVQLVQTCLDGFQPFFSACGAD